VFASRAAKLKALRQFIPAAVSDDWELITAGQRVQVMKKDAKLGGVLQFGTEVITSSDGSIAGLLGASPGASTAAPIMVDLLARCFPDHIEAWKPRIRAMIPSYGTRLSDNPAAAAASLAATAEVLHLSN
jgi:malate dehydrogenase (quinone)